MRSLSNPTLNGPARQSRMQWRDQREDLVCILWIIAKCAIVAASVLLCGRGLQLLSIELFVNGAETWSVSMVRTLSDVFAIVTFVCLALRDIWLYFFSQEN
jgi:hypothetical protein